MPIGTQQMHRHSCCSQFLLSPNSPWMCLVLCTRTYVTPGAAAVSVQLLHPNSYGTAGTGMHATPVHLCASKTLPCSVHGSDCPVLTRPYLSKNVFICGFFFFVWVLSIINKQNLCVISFNILCFLILQKIWRCLRVSSSSASSDTTKCLHLFSYWIYTQSNGEFWKCNWLFPYSKFTTCILHMSLSQMSWQLRSV